MTYIDIDETYTYVDNGIVEVRRDDDEWLVNPPGSKAWTAAAHVIEWLRGRVRDLNRMYADEKRRADANWAALSEWSGRAAAAENQMSWLQMQISTQKTQIEELQKRVRLLEGEEAADD